LIFLCYYGIDKNGSDFMSDTKKAVCGNCVHFSSGVSDNGYCSFYHHKISIPERICSRYEQKTEEEINSDEQKIDVQPAPIKRKAKNHSYWAYVIGMVCVFMLSLCGLLIDVNFAIVLFTNKIPMPVKIGIIVVALAAFALVFWEILHLLRKYRWVYIIYLIVCVALIFMLLFDFGNVWLSISNFLNSIVEGIMNVFGYN
jgi:hypothetical protein